MIRILKWGAACHSTTVREKFSAYSGKQWMKTGVALYLKCWRLKIISLWGTTLVFERNTVLYDTARLQGRSEKIAFDEKTKPKRKEGKQYMPNIASQSTILSSSKFAIFSTSVHVLSPNRPFVYHC